MIFLEKGVYAKAYVEEVFGKTYKRVTQDLINGDLKKCGYEATYQAKGKKVIITKAPETQLERINEAAVRALNLSGHISDPAAYALVFYLSALDEDFASSPWLTKEKILKEEFHLDITYDSKMKNWMKKWCAEGAFIKGIETFYWKTTFNNHEKIQSRVETKEDKESMRKYYSKINELLQKAQKANLSTREAWGAAISLSIKQDKVIYYKVHPFIFQTFASEDILFLFNLITEWYFSESSLDELEEECLNNGSYYGKNVINKEKTANDSLNFKEKWFLNCS